MRKLLKIIGWIILGPVVWVFLSVFMAVIVAIALFQIAVDGRPKKVLPQKNFGLTPPDKSIIILN